MNTYYKNTLYPLQDNILKVVASLNTDFYLTGGTALSRCYYEYRYSDDLDLFLNNDKTFKEQVFKIIGDIRKNNFTLEMKTQSDSYYSIKIDNTLKIDFVNDIPSHIGKFENKTIFPKVDNLQNILSNKITALISRDEPKDVVDIWVINKNIKIDWKKIFTDVESKAVGILPPAVAQKIETFPIELLEQIQWVEESKPEFSLFEKDVQQIVKDILMI
jgi:predicted nucleotidyltransferase component of viral defense system